tara:strand:+ start:137 stop:703 length:567 start_codon:yes stop_codon:yes gene_type:complete
MTDPVPRELNLENLSIISSAIPKYWEHFLFYGTLLGFHREGNILENDDDVDIMMERGLREEFLKLVVTYTPFNIRLNNRDITQLIRTINGISTYVDIYYYYNVPEKDHIIDRWNTRCTPITTEDGQKIRGQTLKIPKDILFPIKIDYLQDIPVNIPHKPEDCCRYVYGKSFMTPSHKHSGGFYEILKP